MISLLKILNELEINKPRNFKKEGYIYYPKIKTWILWDEDSNKTSSADNEGFGCKVWGNDPQNNEYYAFFYKFYIDDEGNHITGDKWEEIGEYDLTNYENSELVELIFLGKGNSSNIVLFDGENWHQKLNELEINNPNKIYAGKIGTYAVDILEKLFLDGDIYYKDEYPGMYVLGFIGLPAMETNDWKNIFSKHSHFKAIDDKIIIPKNKVHFKLSELEINKPNNYIFILKNKSVYTAYYAIKGCDNCLEFYQNFFTANTGLFRSNYYDKDEQKCINTINFLKKKKIKYKEHYGAGYNWITINDTTGLLNKKFDDKGNLLNELEINKPGKNYRSEIDNLKSDIFFKATNDIAIKEMVSVLKNMGFYNKDLPSYPYIDKWLDQLDFSQQKELYKKLLYIKEKHNIS